MKGAAYYWWKQLQDDRNRNGKGEIISWPEMKNLLLIKFSPAKCSTKCFSRQGVEAKTAAETYSKRIENGKDGEERLLARRNSPTDCLMKVQSSVFRFQLGTEAKESPEQSRYCGSTDDSLYLSSIPIGVCKVPEDDIVEISDPKHDTITENEAAQVGKVIEKASNILEHKNGENVNKADENSKEEAESFTHITCLMKLPYELNGDGNNSEKSLGKNTPTVPETILELMPGNNKFKIHGIGEEKNETIPLMVISTPIAILSSLIKHRSLLEEFVGAFLAHWCKFVKVGAIRNGKTQFWVLLSWSGAYIKMVVLLFDPGGNPISEERKINMWISQGKHIVLVEEGPYKSSSLNLKGGATMAAICYCIRKRKRQCCCTSKCPGVNVKGELMMYTFDPGGCWSINKFKCQLLFPFYLCLGIMKDLICEQKDPALNLTRGRVIPWEGWNDEYNSYIFVMTKRNVVTITLCLSILGKNRPWKRTLKLFHKVVNGLDPPKDSMVPSGASMC